MKIMIDGVFYNPEPIDFQKILQRLVEILGEDLKVLSLEFPELAAIYEPECYYRSGFCLDKEIEVELTEMELKEIREKIIKEFPRDTIVYSLNCEIL
ncbi:conserved hypothetical protein [Methanococcus vannielii SB]|uniref:Uncharacterized protein n=1 Tax=Methanococcus vannielii (strain ATCC 35089 / DSM 1224 / JCM 13029 / OCM 148 / SB) TaxID=406327 RepID=A6UQH7_METVS|nr:hypothetical protein [Methanococcus vannielii]ABR54749.1 conserved hypothetical protein [Methanococcus vannielii SB]